MAQTPAQRRASDAVAAWLAANEKNPAWLVSATRADPGTIGDFLNGTRWPKVGTQGKMEKALGWPAGTIRQIGNGGDVPPDLVYTETVTLEDNATVELTPAQLAEIEDEVAEFKDLLIRRAQRRLKNKSAGDRWPYGDT